MGTDPSRSVEGCLHAGHCTISPRRRQRLPGAVPLRVELALALFARAALRGMENPVELLRARDSMLSKPP